MKRRDIIKHMGLGDMSPEDNSGDGGSSGARRYVQPDRDEFEDCLFNTRDGWRQADRGEYNSIELVYENHEFAPNYTGVVLTCFSTIDRRTGKARSKGSDAIRLVAWSKHVDRPIHGREKTLRIETWCKNLTEKVEWYFYNTNEVITICEECGGVMILRDGRFGEFYGCSNYPRCDHTEDVS